MAPVIFFMSFLAEEALQWLLMAALLCERLGMSFVKERIKRIYFLLWHLPFSNNMNQLSLHSKLFQLSMKKIEFIYAKRSRKLL